MAIDTTKVQDFAELAVTGMSDVANVGADESVEKAAGEIVAYWEGESGLLSGSDLERWKTLSPTSEDEDELRGRCVALVEAAIRRQRAA